MDFKKSEFLLLAKWWPVLKFLWIFFVRVFKLFVPFYISNVIFFFHFHATRYLYRMNCFECCASIKSWNDEKNDECSCWCVYVCEFLFFFFSFALSCFTDSTKVMYNVWYIWKYVCFVYHIVTPVMSCLMSIYFSTMLPSFILKPKKIVHLIPFASKWEKENIF